MRRNEPVTQREYPFPEGESLVSVTDAKGRITYCNASFVAVSGFERGELLGQPHNIVRHPDMPEEAFRDLWATIQSGYPWTGLVKNRRKDGDHYWVRANATPMRDGDRITGYLSVRTQPSRAEVQAAEALYRRMNEEARSGRRTLGLNAGQLQRSGLRGRLSAWLHPEPRTLLGGLVALLGLALLLSAQYLGAFSIWSLLLLVLLVVVAVAQVQRGVYAPLQQSLRGANGLAACDLSQNLEEGRSGVLGHVQNAMRQMGVNLRVVVGDTRGGLDRVRHSFHEIAAGNQDLSSRTESQASSLQQTAASMEQIQATVRRTADIAIEGAELAARTAGVAERSQQAVNAVADTVERIAGSSKQIAEIIQVVEGVAFQTNILALNAAVEAARAGEQGRGFAVVAAEVRALAQRTTGAAREIRELITASNELVAGGSARAGEARERMQEAVLAVRRVTESLESIRTAAVEQQSGIAQVNDAITHLDSLTQQNAAMVEQIAASTQSLESEVEAVSQSMRMFRLQRGDRTVADADAVELRRAAK